MKAFARKRRWFAMLLALLLLLSPAAALAEILPLRIDVTYGQTEAREMLELINEFRASDDAWYWDASNTTKIYSTSKYPLIYDYALERAAMQRTAEIALSYSHTRPNGSRCFTVMDDIYGENIAAGYGSGNSVFIGWREDDEPHDGQGHRINMLSGFTHIGIGHVVYQGVHYWAQEFGYGPDDTTATTANDALTGVDIEAASEKLSDWQVDCPVTDIRLKQGASMAVPQLSVSVEVADFWSYLTDRCALSGKTAAVSADPSILSVSGDTLTARSAGSTTLTLTSNSRSVELPVLVEEAVALRISADAASVAVGDSFRADVTITPAAASQEYTLRSSNTAVAKISGKTVIPVGAGTARITYTAAADSSATAVLQLTVSASQSTLKLPQNTKTVSARALAATAAQKIVLPEGLSSIASDALSGCTALRLLELRSTTLALPAALLRQLPDAVLLCPAQSAAATAAKAAELPYLLLP